MKKVVKGIAAIVVVMVAWLGVSAIEQHYTREGYVLECNDDTCIIVDYETNNEWSIDKEEGLHEGDEVVLYMSTRGTDNITDDAITKVEMK